MNSHQKKLLHYALIILLMMAPLRSVLATQLMACDMKIASPGVTVSAERGQHMMDDGSMMNTTAPDMQDAFLQIDKQAKSCCNSSGACMSDCHIAISASLFIQPVDYSPALLVIDTFDSVSSLLIVRELSPPSRPPLSLYS